MGCRITSIASCLRCPHKVCLLDLEKEEPNVQTREGRKAAYLKAYYQANKERIAEYKKAYRNKRQEG